MTKMIEIAIVHPARMKILVPQWIFEELQQKVEKGNLSEIITEALMEELKKLRFRLDLQKISGRIVEHKQPMGQRVVS